MFETLTAMSSISVLHSHDGERMPSWRGHLGGSCGRGASFGARPGHDARVSATSDGGVEIRTATGADSAAIVAVWAANGDEIPAGGVDIMTPYLAHLMATGRVLVASDAGGVVGFAAVVERAGVTHLADLFVLPDRFGEGTGGQLLAAVMGDATRRTTFASSDPRALPLYVRNGMIPWWPNLYLDIDSGCLPSTFSPHQL